MLAIVRWREGRWRRGRQREALERELHVVAFVASVTNPLLHVKGRAAGERRAATSGRLRRRLVILVLLARRHALALHQVAQHVQVEDIQRRPRGLGALKNRLRLRPDSCAKFLVLARLLVVALALVNPAHALVVSRGESGRPAAVRAVLPRADPRQHPVCGPRAAPQ